MRRKTHTTFWKVKVKSLSRVRLFGTPWTVACQAPLSMGFSRQECWNGLPFPSPGDSSRHFGNSYQFTLHIFLIRRKLHLKIRKMQEYKEMQNFMWVAENGLWRDCGHFHDWEFVLFLKEKVRASPQICPGGEREARSWCQRRFI